MADQHHGLENEKNTIYLEQKKVYENTLKKQCFEIELWKMRIEMISNMKNKQIQILNDRITEMVCFIFLIMNK